MFFIFWSALLSSLTGDQTRLLIGIATSVGAVTLAGLVYWYRKYRADKPPKEWRRVGELSDLICYPIKSCGPVKLKSITCSKLGLENGDLRDRVFMVITTNGEFLTGRQYPKLTLVHPEITENKMSLAAPGMMDIEVDIERLYKIPKVRCKVWGQTVTAVDCGEEVARWFSRYLLMEDFGLRLMFYPARTPSRDVRAKFANFVTMSSQDTGAFHDSTSFMLFNESSVHDLNTRLDEPVQTLCFRPNFVVRGPVPYDEDNWKWVKIGNDAIFKNIKPCTRCIFTTVNPETGKFRSDGNPLKVLNEYRLFKEVGSSPALGISLGLRGPGKVSIGDPIYVGVF